MQAWRGRGQVRVLRAARGRGRDGGVAGATRCGACTWGQRHVNTQPAARNSAPSSLERKPLRPSTSAGGPSSPAAVAACRPGRTHGACAAARVGSRAPPRRHRGIRCARSDGRGCAASAADTRHPPGGRALFILPGVTARLPCGCMGQSAQPHPQCCGPALQAVFGPAEDGGYYLLALTSLPQALFEVGEPIQLVLTAVGCSLPSCGKPSLPPTYTLPSQGIEWSTSAVLAASINNAQREGLDVAPLGALPRLLDIDTVSDLQCWVDSLEPGTLRQAQRSLLRQVAERIVQQHSKAPHG